MTIQHLIERLRRLNTRIDLMKWIITPEDLKELLQISIEYLEKLNPKKPKPEQLLFNEKNKTPTFDCWSCPICGSYLNDKDVPVQYRRNYCSRCGQAIDWNVEEGQNG